MKKHRPLKKQPLYALIGIIFALFIGSILCIYLGNFSAKAYTAYIYQDGILIKTIDLSAVKEITVFTVNSTDGGYNTIEIRPGEIAVTSASCPDHVCMKQGFIQNSMLPITCLPNKLVIQLKENTSGIVPDAVTY